MAFFFNSTHMKTAVFLYYFLFLACIFQNVQAQPDPKWTIGIGLRPLEWETNPYNFTLKRKLGKHFDLRAGAAFHSSSVEFYEYIFFPYHSLSDNSYGAEFQGTKKNYYWNNFTGIQANKRFNNLTLFLFIDLTYEYYKQEYEFGAGDFTLRPKNPRFGDYMVFGPYYDYKRNQFGIRSGIGAKYVFNRSFSIAFEAVYSIKKVNLIGYYITLSDVVDIVDNTVKLNSFIHQNEPIKNQTVQTAIQPLSMLSLLYHF